MIGGGAADAASLDDDKAWQTAADELLSIIHADGIDLVGLPCNGQLPEKIPGHQLALIKVLNLGMPSVTDIVLDAPSYIECTPFLSEDDWKADGNDKLFLRGQGSPAWTHLQLRKKDVLSQWPAWHTTQHKSKEESPSSVVSGAKLSEPSVDRASDGACVQSSLEKSGNSVRRAPSEIFREWRAQAQSAGRIPTYKEDVAHMKKFDVTRDRVRELRTKYPTLPRGTPRTNRRVKSAEI